MLQEGLLVPISGREGRPSQTLVAGVANDVLSRRKRALEISQTGAVASASDSPCDRLALYVKVLHLVKSCVVCQSGTSRKQEGRPPGDEPGPPPYVPASIPPAAL
jgi:hypothetical protein